MDLAPRRWLKQLARRAGYEVTRVGGRGASARVMSGSAYEATLGETRAAFFVWRPQDAIQHRHWTGAFYEPEEIAIIDHHFAGGTFVDIGANVGNHAVFFALQPKTRRVIAFEPNPLAFAGLAFNMALNGLGDVDIRRLALSDREGEAELATPEDDNLGGTTLREDLRSGAKPSARCRLVRGDDALAGVDVDFVKIDVEGHELPCLHGLSETLARCRPGLFVEVLDREAAAIAAFLGERDYRAAERFSRYPGITNHLWLPG